MTRQAETIINKYKELARNAILINSQYLDLWNSSGDIDRIQIAEILAKLTGITNEYELESLNSTQKSLEIINYMRKEKERLEKEFITLKRSIAGTETQTKKEKQNLQAISKDCLIFLDFVQKMKLNDLEQKFKNF